ncbi:MAG: DUF5658 family protein [Candidatus Methanoperedens sp.]|nr:DUF5658 family protein [Candidatus Methanoperedens sp.]MCZ7369515.1 DUF5658 family protein [Candidatus Methanoperedens sp.]
MNLLKLRYDEALCIVTGFQVLDVGFTYYALEILKLHEANRLMYYLFDNFGFMIALFFKILYMSAIIYFCHRYFRLGEKFGYFALIIFYNLVLFNNVLSIFSKLAVVN